MSVLHITEPGLSLTASVHEARASAGPYWHTLAYQAAYAAYTALMGRPVRLSLALPQIPGETDVANFQLKNDVVLTIAIQAKDANGVLAPLPPADTFTVVSSDPSSLNAVIGADASGNPAVVLNAAKQAASGISVTLSDSHGLTPFTLVVDVVSDVSVAVSLFLDPTTGTTTSQPPPAV